MKYNAVDLFSGCGGMTEGLINAGFRVISAIELDKDAAQAYLLNHQQHGVKLFLEDIRDVHADRIAQILSGERLHLLAGCPPCQGFSLIRRKNKKKPIPDSRNSLILEYLRFVEALSPMTIMLENVAGIKDYHLFKKVFKKLEALGYYLTSGVVDAASYGVPQRRKRFVLLGSLISQIQIPKGSSTMVTVRNAIGNLEAPENSVDALHNRYPRHTVNIMERIKLIPCDGGSRKDLPEIYTLKCHKKDGVGFKDVYGRLKWDNVSSTITGGCLNPSKGRFLHPEKHRCITAREAAILQSFRRNYIFPENISLTKIAQMIGNALPPLFCQAQGEAIKDNLDLIFFKN